MTTKTVSVIYIDDLDPAISRACLDYAREAKLGLADADPEIHFSVAKNGDYGTTYAALLVWR